MDRHTKLCSQKYRLLGTDRKCHKKEQNLPHFLCAGRVTECSKNFPFLLVSIRNFSNRVLVDKDKFIDPYGLVPIK